ncbi:hypothetical protein C8R44DRAFT_989538 [Mycena epipterygia]|nr:hypothetical protein C8R44DRAFT_989538 [Mycena epipterygia]
MGRSVAGGSTHMPAPQLQDLGAFALHFRAPALPISISGRPFRPTRAVSGIDARNLVDGGRAYHDGRAESVRARGGAASQRTAAAPGAARVHAPSSLVPLARVPPRTAAITRHIVTCTRSSTTYALHTTAAAPPSTLPRTHDSVRGFPRSSREWLRTRRRAPRVRASGRPTAQLGAGCRRRETGDGMDLDGEREGGRGRSANAFRPLRRGAAREEVIVDWEWDDASAVHRVGEVAGCRAPADTNADLAPARHVAGEYSARSAARAQGTQVCVWGATISSPEVLAYQSAYLRARASSSSAFPACWQVVQHDYITTSISSRTPSRRAFIRPYKMLAEGTSPSASFARLSLVLPHPGTPMAPPTQNGGGVIQIVHTDDAVTKLSAPLLQLLHH